MNMEAVVVIIAATAFMYFLCNLWYNHRKVHLVCGLEKEKKCQ